VNQNHDEDLEALKIVWHKLTWWQKKHIVFLATYYLVKSELKRIPIRWILWQLRRK
jgi:hypothetical protein